MSNVDTRLFFKYQTNRHGRIRQTCKADVIRMGGPSPTTCVRESLSFLPLKPQQIEIELASNNGGQTPPPHLEKSLPAALRLAAFGFYPFVTATEICKRVLPV